MNSGNGGAAGNTRDVGRLMREAVAHHQAGRFQQAESLYRTVLQTQPGHADASHNLGVAALQTNRPAEALPHLKAALEARPEVGQYWLSYLAALTQAGHMEVARQVLAQAMQRGLTGPEVDKLAARLGQVAEAGPTQAEIGQALALFNEKRYLEVEPMARTLTQRFPEHGFGWQLLGVVLKEQGRHDEALVSMQRAAALSPGNPQRWIDLGLLYQTMGRLHDAESSHRRAVEVCPDSLAAYYNLGNVLMTLGRLEEAEASYRHALELDGSIAQVHNNLGYLLGVEGRSDEAEAMFRQAMALDPHAFDAPNNLAALLHRVGRLAEAELCCLSALALNPNVTDPHVNLGLILQDQGRIAEAEGSFRRAAELNSRLPAPFYNLGNLLLLHGRFQDAEASYRRALSLLADSRTFVNFLFATNYHPDKSAEEIFEVYREYEAALARPHYGSWPGHSNDRNSARRLRLGYISPDFRQHSTRHFLEPLLAHHDRERFEIHAYAELSKEDEFTERYRSHVDHWLNTKGMSDDALAERIRADGIDILVDLAGHTNGNRLLVFARKPAPVSVSWLGYGYTTGLTAIDYLLTDEASAPAGSEHLFAEQPWRLATPGFAYRPAEGMGEVDGLPALERGHITLGTLTRAIRINHRVVRVWSEILHRLPEARLVIDSRNYISAEMQGYLAGQFAARGIARERLELGFHSPPWDVLRGMDIGLDCFPHNSGTTLFESLYMGVPFVTLAGRPSVGRLGSSILEGVGHPEWIAHTEEEYIEKVVSLAGDLPKLAGLRAGLRREMERSPLMDEVGFARKVEDAYREMFKRWADRVEQ